MKKRICQIFALLLSVYQIAQAQESEIIENARLLTITNWSIIYNNEPMDEICMEDDSIYIASTNTKRKIFSFALEVDIRTGHHGDNENWITSIEGVVVNGKKSGLWRKGGREALREDTYHNGLLHGISRVYSYQGKRLCQTIFIEGTGYYKDYYHANEQLYIHGEMQNGKRTGRWRTYYEDGTLKYDETYRDGLLDGKYTSYDPKGNILYTTEFNNGTGWLKSFDVPEGILWEEGHIEKGYRVGIWTRVDEHYSRIENKLILRETKIEQSPDSPENKRMHHNLIEIVHHNGKTYYINASDPKEKKDLGL